MKNPLLPKGQTQVVTKGANGHRTAFYSVSTTADGKEERTLVNSVVSQEAVTQVVEVGTAVEKTENAQSTTVKADEKTTPCNRKSRFCRLGRSRPHGDSSSLRTD